MQIFGDCVYGRVYLPVSIASGELQLRTLASTQIIHEYLRLYDWRTLSQQSFLSMSIRSQDTVDFLCIPPYFFVIFL